MDKTAHRSVYELNAAVMEELNSLSEDFVIRNRRDICAHVQSVIINSGGHIE